MEQATPDTSCLDMLGDLDCYDTFQHAELFTDSFIQLHTDFPSVETFFSGLPAPEKCNYLILDIYVQDHTDFESWIELLCAAKV